MYPILREVSVSETRELEVSSVCGLVPASKINCLVSAVNVAGESKQTVASGYTSLSCMYCWLLHKYTTSFSFNYMVMCLGMKSSLKFEKQL